MMLLALFCQAIVVAVIVVLIAYDIRRSRPKGPRGGETWQWDEPPQRGNPAERANAQTGSGATPTI